MAVKANVYVLLNFSVLHSALGKSVLKLAFFFLSGKTIALSELTGQRGFYGLPFQCLWRSPG